jgi:hypothetical protein
MKYLTLLIICVTIGCKGQKETLNNSESTENTSEELTLDLSDNYGGTELQDIQVIRDPGTFKSFFTQINKTRKPGIPVPKVDFSKEMVVIYCSGKTTNGDVPGLFMISETDDKMILGLKKQNEHETSSTALVMPFGVYTMPHSDKEVVLDSPE